MLKTMTIAHSINHLIEELIEDIFSPSEKS